ncbi:calcineurin-like phosphoesterase C-terminal domain-containing protein [Cellulomonas sp. JZ18]|uniref:calcineurin-like phosphoesterase C-terminal domain-containing protein n=1 Tax=Cellulomonas sp. JZ18 TaxID=2654191 RepID=UPI001E391540|nr:calcineurin-like phosphoesterase C-terminal domain-containing protein [Cellulomonas sp. JZ18]
MRPTARRTAVTSIAVAATTLCVSGLVLAPTAHAEGRHGDRPGHSWDRTAYRGDVHVVPGPDEDQGVVDGTVFDDRNRNSRQDRGERGVPGVVVSNGLEVTRTDRHGRYSLPATDNFTVFVTQPAGYQVPVDDDNVARFFYHHLPAGSPPLRYGGLAPTGELPDQVNFPLVRSGLTASHEQHCLIGGDIQTYDLAEVEYARAGAFADLAERTDYTGCGALFVGDVVGDDLSLYPQTRELVRMINGPARFLPGNHDLDFDATDSAHTFDTFKAHLAPEYYSYDVGKVHVVALNTVEYPVPGGYTGALDARQLEWLRNDIAAVPRDRLVVVAAHIPLLDFADSDSAKHQVAQVREVVEILEGREVLSLGGHTHSIENLEKGDSLAGWKNLFGIDALPFDHITVGAISGDWYSGAVQPEGYPTALQRDGGKPGVLTLDIRGRHVRERFTVRGGDDAEQMALGLNTPRYREWFAAHRGAVGSAPELTDPLVVSRADLQGTTWLTTNFWMGSTGAKVVARIDGGRPVSAVRTQPMRGEGQLVGAEHSDPVAVQQQLVHGGSVADRTSHLWRLELPADLAAGEHTATVTATDAHGRRYTDTLTFTVSG